MKQHAVKAAILVGHIVQCSGNTTRHHGTLAGQLGLNGKHREFRCDAVKQGLPKPSGAALQAPVECVWVTEASMSGAEAAASADLWAEATC